MDLGAGVVFFTHTLFREFSYTAPCHHTCIYIQLSRISGRNPPSIGISLHGNNTLVPLTARRRFALDFFRLNLRRPLCIPPRYRIVSLTSPVRVDVVVFLQYLTVTIDLTLSSSRTRTQSSHLVQSVTPFPRAATFPSNTHASRSSFLLSFLGLSSSSSSSKAQTPRSRPPSSPR